MSSLALNRELVFLILQFLKEQNFKDSMHRFEKETGCFFNTKYFDEKVLAGEWDEVEKYLLGFTKVDDNVGISPLIDSNDKASKKIQSKEVSRLQKEEEETKKMKKSEELEGGSVEKHKNEEKELCAG